MADLDLADALALPEVADQGPRRALTPRARALAEELMSRPHVSELDRIAAEELASMVTVIEGLDAEIASGAASDRDRRSVIKLRILASRRLEGWAAAFGLTPRDRAAMLKEALAGRTLVADINRRRAELDDDSL